MRVKRLVLLLAVIAAILAGAAVLHLRRAEAAPGPAFEEYNEEEASTGYEITDEMLGRRVLQSTILLPPGSLLVTQPRAAYESGEMRLVIPRLELDVPVLGDTTLETLEHGPGLYKYSQIPDIYNTNVSIAAHRDLFGCEFYYLDTLAEGDCLYLINGGYVFRYEYRSTEIVEDNDWDPIRTAHDSRITLTTCDPIGTSLQRMVAVGELVAVEEYEDGYEFQ